jgi:hypothetical protein
MLTLGQLGERAHHAADQVQEALALLLAPQPQVGRDLVVARAARVELLAQVT